MKPDQDEKSGNLHENRKSKENWLGVFEEYNCL
jgi:hypothetical protein